MTTPAPHLTFIGAGNMTYSLVVGLLKNGHDPARICVADPFDRQLEKFRPLAITTYTDNSEAITGADVVVLAVKPQIAQGVVTEFQTLKAGQLLLSIAAGINIASLAKWSAQEQAIVRCMPNTPALLGAGMSALFANSNCNTAQVGTAEYILQAAGDALWVNHEGELDAVTAVSGSGPAYFFLLMESMIDAGVELGLEPEIAARLTLQTAYGAALMAKESSDRPDALRQNVTSPGGTTAAALDVMIKQHMPDTVASAIQAANERAEQLAKEFGGDQEP